LVLASYACVACEGDADAKQKVQKATIDFAKLLPQLHPDKTCRDALRIASAIGDPERMLNAVAEASWECLDPALKCSSTKWFCNVDDATTRRLQDFSVETGRRLLPLADLSSSGNVPEGVASKLSACAQTNTVWSRACSYWAIMHTFGLRADGTSKRGEFFMSLAPMLAGGALMCWS